MSYSEELDARITHVIKGWGAARKKMFGGTCHLIGGNMMCGVYRDSLILRLGTAQAEKALGKPHVRPFDITGRPMNGWVMVDGAGFEGEALKEWLEKALRFVKTLPPK